MNTMQEVSKRTARSRSARIIAALLFGLLALAAQVGAESIKHEFFMQGQILSKDAKSIVVCIGSRDGAVVGDELSVIHHSAVAGPAKSAPKFKREVIGKARVVDVFDDHYATLEVIEGKAGVHDMVELERK